MMRAIKLIALLFLLAFSGCGPTGPVADYSKVNLTVGQGKVTLDGRPLANAVITFDDPTDDTFSYARTDAQGNYLLQFDSEMKGVTTGNKIVRISTTRKLLALAGKPGKSEGEELREGDEGEETPEPRGEKKELVPSRYNTESELQVEVTSTSPPFNFDLKSE